MSFWNIQRPFNQDKPVIGSHYFSAEKSVTLSATYVGLNEYGVKAVPAGLFIANVGGIDRFLPRDTVRTTAITGSSSTAIKVNYPELFRAGDVLYALEPEGLITLSGTWAADDTVTIRFSEASLGINIQSTLTSGGALSAFDDAAVAELNLSTNPLSKYARFEVGTTGQIKVFSKGLVFTMSVTEGADDVSGAAAVTTQLAPAPRLIGTVSNVDYANKELDLGAAAAVSLAAGGQLGTLTQEIYGLYNHSVDFTDRPLCTLKAIDRCDRVYTTALPYFDHQLMARFPRLKFV
jgi:hypothetical protein